MQRLDEIQACFKNHPKIPKIMISGIVILTKSVNLPLLLASPVKDANDMINTAFTLMRRLKYKLNLHSQSIKHALVACVLIGREARIFLSDKTTFRLRLVLEC